MKKVLLAALIVCLLLTCCTKKSSNVFTDSKATESSTATESSKEDSSKEESSKAPESESSKEESSVEESSVEESSVEESSVEESSETIESESSVEESSEEESSVEEPAAEESSESEAPVEVPEDFAMQEYFELQFGTPSDWTREGEGTEDAASVFFYGENIMLQLSSAGSTVPNVLDESTKSSWIEGFGSAFENFTPENITDTTIAGKDAFRYEFSADAQSRTFLGDSVIFQSDTRLYVFVIYSTDPNATRDSYIDVFEAILKSITINA